MNEDFSFDNDFNPDESFESDDRNALDSQENALSRAKAGRYSEGTVHRRGLVKWVKWLIPAYLACIVTILLLVGLDGFRLTLLGKAFAPEFGFALSDGVLVALLCTTTANVLGLSAIVLRGLFR